jgi:hypothetical protein
VRGYGRSRVVWAQVHHGGEAPDHDRHEEPLAGALVVGTQPLGYAHGHPVPRQVAREREADDASQDRLEPGHRAEPTARHSSSGHPQREALASRVSKVFRRSCYALIFLYFPEASCTTLGAARSGASGTEVGAERLRVRGRREWACISVIVRK